MRTSLFLLLILLVFMLAIPFKHSGFRKPNQENINDEVKIYSPKRFEASDDNSPLDLPFVSKDIPKTTSIDISTPFRILDISSGEIVKVSQRDYVVGAICAEMPPDFHTEALKCQAVAAHTYAIYNSLHKNPELNGADFSADPSNWKGYVTKKQAKERFGDKFDIYWGKIQSASDEVFKNVMVYQEEPILAAYHSTSSGMTESAANVWSGAAPAYLSPVDSNGDILANDYETKTKYKIQTVKNILLATDPHIILDNDASKWFNIVSRSPSKYVTCVEVGNVILTGKQMRNLFDLRSSCFDIELNGEEFVFTVHGYGHGVGLSQYGADYFARQGLSCQEIMQHYYSGATMVECAE